MPFTFVIYAINITYITITVIYYYYAAVRRIYYYYYAALFEVYAIHLLRLRRTYIRLPPVITYTYYFIGC